MSSTTSLPDKLQNIFDQAEKNSQKILNTLQKVLDRPISTSSNPLKEVDEASLKIQLTNNASAVIPENTDELLDGEITTAAMPTEDTLTTAIGQEPSSNNNLKPAIADIPLIISQEGTEDDLVQAIKESVSAGINALKNEENAQC